MTRKKYLVIFDEAWILDQIPTERSERYAALDLKKVSFKDAPITSTVDGTKIADSWMLSQVDTNKYDGVIAVMAKVRLDGRHGVHVKKLVTHNDRTKRFSIIQVEAHRGWYRRWKQQTDTKWELVMTRQRKNSPYRQLTYTFDHELGHSLCYLNFIFDSLHLFVQRKMYEDWWHLVMKP